MIRGGALRCVRRAAASYGRTAGPQPALKPVMMAASGGTLPVEALVRHRTWMVWVPAGTAISVVTGIVTSGAAGVSEPLDRAEGTASEPSRARPQVALAIVTPSSVTVAFTR